MVTTPLLTFQQAIRITHRLEHGWALRSMTTTKNLQKMYFFSICHYSLNVNSYMQWTNGLRGKYTSRHISSVKQDDYSLYFSKRAEMVFFLTDRNHPAKIEITPHDGVTPHRNHPTSKLL